MFTGMDDEHPGYTFYPNPTGLSDVVVELTPSIGGLSRDHLAERSAPQAIGRRSGILERCYSRSQPEDSIEAIWIR